MRYRSEELIPVRSESELRAGMTVVRRACDDCGVDHVEILVASVARLEEGFCPTCMFDGLGDNLRAGWKVVTGCCADANHVDSIGCYCRSIATGRLFRLDTGIDEEADRRQAEEDKTSIALIDACKKLKEFGRPVR